MKKSLFVIIVTTALTTILFLGISLNAIAARSPKTIIGEVTLVGDNTLKMKEDKTQTEYELTASKAKLKNLNKGQRIEVETSNGKILSLTILGMPMEAQPEPDQKWKGNKEQ
jgi:hypothetical protein